MVKLLRLGKKRINSFVLLLTFRNFEPEYEGVTVLWKIPQCISLGQFVSNDALGGRRLLCRQVWY